MYAQVHSLNMFTNRCKKMIYIRKIRPLSELHYAVCLSGMWCPQCSARWLRSGCRAPRLVLEESHRRRGIQGHRDQVTGEIFIVVFQSSFQPKFHQKLTFNTQYFFFFSPSTFKLLHTADKKHFFLEKKYNLGQSLKYNSWLKLSPLISE